MKYIHSTFLSTDGQELHYERVGEREPLVLLGGGPGASPEYLYPIAEAVTDFRSIVIVHQRGTGRSVVEQPSIVTINVERSIADVEALRQHLAIDQIDILGHSWGGMLAMAYAGSYPLNVSSLTLVCSGGMKPKMYNYYGDNIRAYLTQRERDTIDEYERLYVETGDQSHRYSHYKVVAPVLVYDRSKSKQCEDILTSINLVTEELIGESLRTCGVDVTMAMSRFDKPVKLIYGRQDYIGEGVAYQAQEIFRKSHIDWIERSGHFPWLDNPEAFFSALRQGLTPVAVSS